MTITIVSILIISVAILVTKKIWPTFRLCPICTGVSGTWLWMLMANYYGYPTDTNIVSLLMGGSVVGIAYQLEKKIRPGKAMAWKILFIPAGFTLVYDLIYLSWLYLALSTAVIFVLLFIFLFWPVPGGVHSKGNGHNVEGLEEKMKNCC